jgi:hypothetical protein
MLPITTSPSSGNYGINEIRHFYLIIFIQYIFLVIYLYLKFMTANKINWKKNFKNNKIKKRIKNRMMI